VNRDLGEHWASGWDCASPEDFQLQMRMRLEWESELLAESEEPWSLGLALPAVINPRPSPRSSTATTP